MAERKYVQETMERKHPRRRPQGPRRLVGVVTIEHHGLMFDDGDEIGIVSDVVKSM